MILSNKFAGQVALVTGASSGIGKATALLFAQHGAKVAVVNRTPEAGRAVAQEIRDFGGEAIAITCDVAKRDQVEQMVATTVDTWGRLDMAYNNAGHSVIKGMIDITEEEWDAIVDITLKGTWLCMKYEIIQMLKQGKGAIVNCGSAAGVLAVSSIAPYTAAKHGVVGLTKNAAIEYIGRGIRVNIVNPGAIQTPMLDEFTGKQEAVLNYLSARQAIGRIGQAEEIARAVVWLASDDASFINGAVVAADGGWTAH
ncbi:MAG: SDR family oxidoreductase [Bernardetiaceae bacterium]|jgi:NAD(P)-dependent dehydrogenase (short-subunit alcohol dehydrogenase family)|nr:SDR family oxidoreductase [Bernardetiaceae bacterium]